MDGLKLGLKAKETADFIINSISDELSKNKKDKCPNHTKQKNFMNEKGSEKKSKNMGNKSEKDVFDNIEKILSDPEIIKAVNESRKAKWEYGEADTDKPK